MRTPFSFLGNAKTYVCYAMLLLLLAGAAFHGVSDLCYDGDDVEYIEDTVATMQDGTLLFSTQRNFPGRPVVELVFMAGYGIWGDNATAFHILLIGLHVLACWALVATWQFLGIRREVALLGGLLFLLNVAHFRAVHWIACLAYPLAVIFALGTLVCFVRFLGTQKWSWLIVGSAALVVAICTHASAGAVALFCGYYSWRRSKSLLGTLKSAGPILAVALSAMLFLYVQYPKASQITAVDSAFDLMRSFAFWLWYIGRLVSTAHWLPAKLSTQPEAWEIALGGIAAIGIVLLVRFKKSAEADWGIWVFVLLLPFINNPNTIVSGPSRYLYMASAGMSLLWAWGIIVGAERLVDRAGRTGSLAVGVGAIVLLCLSSIWSLHRGEALGFYNSGRASIARNHIALGAAQYERAIRRDRVLIPEEAFHRYATAMFSLGQSPNVLIAEALARSPEDFELQALMGVSSFLTDDREQRNNGWQRIEAALHAAGNSTSMRQKTALALQNLGTYFQEQKHFARAVVLYERALDLRPNYPIGLYNLGCALFADGRPQAAIEAFENALKADPNYIDAWRDVGNVFYQQGDVVKAIQAYERLAAIIPQDVSVLMTLGIMHHQSGQLAEAIRVYERALRLNERNPLLWRNLGVAHHALGNLQAAVRAYRSGLNHDPNDLMMRNNLAGALFALGEKADAVREYQACLRIAPTNASAKQGLAAVLAAQD